MGLIFKGRRPDPMRRVPGRLGKVVETAICREAAENTHLVPKEITDEVGDVADRLGGIYIIGNDLRRAGWRFDRNPGTRDAAREGHPLWARLTETIRRWEPDAPASRTAALQKPTGFTDLLRASVYRMAPLMGPGADLARLYSAPGGLTPFDPGYGGEMYDADHCTGELMRQLLDVTFLDWVTTLEWLRTCWPAMFDAVWTRDAVAVLRLMHTHALPPMPFLRQCKNQRQRLEALVAMFWEAERSFELIYAFGGRERVTISTLCATLGSTSMLGSAIRSDTRSANYAAGSWCHRYTLARLFEHGPNVAHLDQHPHVALGATGDALGMDELAGSASHAALDLIDGNLCTAPPIRIDQRLRMVAGERPAHFFGGRDVRTMAVFFLLEVRQFLGSNQGGRGKTQERWFEVSIDGAIGRLATIITARICPDTAAATMSESVPFLKRDDGPERIALSDLTANPAAWQRHYICPAVQPSPIASASEYLGEDFLGSMVRGVAKEPSAFLNNDPARLGHSLCFRPDAWFNSHAEAAQLAHQWKTAGQHRDAFPGAFDRSISVKGLTFAANVAAQLLPSALEMWQDPHCRKADRLRSFGKPGRPKKRTP